MRGRYLRNCEIVRQKSALDTRTPAMYNVSRKFALSVTRYQRRRIAPEKHEGVSGVKRQYTNGSIVIMDGAVVIGDVTLGEDCGIWFNAVVRGDEAPIIIGARTNIQDCSVLHCFEGIPLRIGEGVTVGHNSILHGCTIGDNTLIGMGSIIMNNAVIGNNCIIGAGSLVPGGHVIPDNSVAMGNPAKVVRQMRDKDIRDNIESALLYMRQKEAYR
jgi:carbonic anhydrase/acetyltransferase-like protein (isoleucine patch superfamily)